MRAAAISWCAPADQPLEPLLKRRALDLFAAAVTSCSWSVQAADEVHPAQLVQQQLQQVQRMLRLSSRNSPKRCSLQPLLKNRKAAHRPVHVQAADEVHLAQPVQQQVQQLERELRSSSRDSLGLPRCCSLQPLLKNRKAAHRPVHVQAADEVHPAQPVQQQVQQLERKMRTSSRDSPGLPKTRSMREEPRPVDRARSASK